MTLFLFGLAFTVLLFGFLKIMLAFLRRVFPEASVLFDSVETLLWILAALFALPVTLAIKPWLP